MGYAFLAIVLLTFPLFLTLLRQHRNLRPMALAAIALFIFCGSAVRIEGNAYGWPMWTGVVKGIALSPIDTLSLALLMTRFKLPGRLPFWSLFALYGAVVALSVAISAVPMASFFSLWQYGRVVLVFAAIGGEIYRPDARAGLLSGLALGMVLQVAYVIQQKASGVVQATGTMNHQNVLGLMTELALIPLLAGMLGGDRRKIVLVGVGASLIVVAGGGSRGTIGFALVGAAILIGLSLARGVTPAKMRVLGLAVLGLAVATPVAIVTLKARFGDTSVTTQDDQRPAFERSARAMADDHPLGVGANLYVTTANIKGYATRAGVAWNFANRSAPVHNAYLLARAETGWLGEILFITLLLVPAAAGLRFSFKMRRGAQGEAVLGSAVALAVNLVHNNYEFASFSFPVFALLSINIGLIAASIRVSRLPRPQVQRRSPAREAAVEAPSLA